MIVTIIPSILKGSIQAPASKSSMQRACAAALVAKGESTIRNPGHSNDDLAAMDIIQKLGASVTLKNESLLVYSEGVRPLVNEINCGESGLSIRMFSPLVALSSKEIKVNGTGSLASRPMNFFDEIFPHLNVKIRSRKGRLPLVIQGPLIPKNVSMDASISSQFLTGLLLAYAACDAKDVSITVTNLKSRPYIDLTLDVMMQFGLKVPENKNYEIFYFDNRPSPDLKTRHIYTVEGDWSGGAFLLVAGAIAGHVTIKGLDVLSTQADKAVLQALMNCGAGISIKPEQIEMQSLPLKGFQFNATDCPDLFPPLVALAAYCEGTTVLEGVSRLEHKESNRALTLKQEFGKMGVEITLQDNLMIVKGGNLVKGARVHSHHDHRVAMACAVAGLRAQGETVIEEADAINKSYPDFYRHIQLLGSVVLESASLPS